MEAVGTMKPAGAGPMAGAGMVSEERYCIKCGYSLIGLPVVGGCPECGTAVEISLREPTLATASREYLETIGRGLALVLNGILLMVVVSAAAMFWGTRGGGSLAAQVVLPFVSLAVSGMILYGYWKYTVPDAGQVMLEATHSARAVVRVAVAVQAGLAAVTLLLGMAGWTTSSPDVRLVIGTATLLFQLAGLVMWLVQIFGVLRYTRWLATRVPDARVLARCKRYRWLLPLIFIVGAIVFLLGPLLALVMYWNLLDRMRKHVKSVLATGAPADLPGRVPAEA